MSETDSNRRQTAISLTVTVVALGLGLVHVLSPGISLDSTALFLLVIALVPWLTPLLKNISLPGGWKLEFRELRREVREELKEKAEIVEDLKSRVREVEQFAFTGVVAADQQQKLNDQLVKYHEYLKELGFTLAGMPPPIDIASYEYINAHYEREPARIVLGQDFADEPDALLREYTHHALMAGLEKQLDWPGMSIESGLSDYLPCSFKGSPLFAPAAAARLHEILHQGESYRPYLRNLRNRLSLEDLDPGKTVTQLSGEVWGGAFWDARLFLGKDLVDRLLVSAWKSTYKGPEATRSATDFVARFLDQARGRVDEETSNQVRSKFTERGLRSKS